jgi:hypothetical protein
MGRLRYSAQRSHYDRGEHGLERARQHIEDAERLSAQLGGTDKDVKEYFFGLLRPQLTQLLDEYEKQYGGPARLYAAATIPKWRSGRVKMGGQTAERLFLLLPPRMPLASKYHLIENLWKQLGPSSKKRIRIGLDADIEQIVETARDHIELVITSYRIPDELEKRFAWLSSGDVGVKQDLLNHLRQMERHLAIQSLRTSLPVLLDHLRSDAGPHTHSAAQILRIGRHEIELLVDRSTAGVTLEEPVVTAASGRQILNSSPSYWFFVVLAIFVLICDIVRR